MDFNNDIDDIHPKKILRWKRVVMVSVVEYIEIIRTKGCLYSWLEFGYEDMQSNHLKTHTSSHEFWIKFELTYVDTKLQGIF